MTAADFDPNPKLAGMSAADQARALGLRVGDTIEGREEWRGGWSESRLTLVWIGKTRAVWSAKNRSSWEPRWSAPAEECNWTLEYRDWRKVEPTPPTGQDRG